MSNLVVYTAIFGTGYDLPRPVRVSAPNVRFVLCHNEQGSVQVPGWESLYIPATKENERRTARRCKLLSHTMFPEAEYTVWHDGTHVLVKDPWSLVAILETQKKSLATFRHPDRSCVYQEHRACSRLKKDDANVMDRQILRYRKEGYPVFHGLVETSCVVRKHTPETKQFNELWHKELSENSVRDQLSFNYTAWKLGFDYGILPGCRDRSSFFQYYPHTRRG